MAGPLFDIYFSGQILDGHDPARARKGVAALFKAKESQVEKLFTGKAVRIKAGVDQDVAVKFRVAFRKVGALVDITPAGTKPAAKKPAPAARPAPPKPAPKPAPKAAAPGLADKDAPKSEPPKPEPPPPQAPGNVELLPPRTGSLEEFGEEETPLEFDLGDLDMSDTDEPLDQTPEQKAPAIDVSDLDMSDTDAPLDQSPEEKPPAIDISDLEAAPPNTGSLEEFAQEEKPLDIDISSLKLDEPK